MDRLFNRGKSLNIKLRGSTTASFKTVSLSNFMLLFDNVCTETVCDVSIILYILFCMIIFNQDCSAIIY